MAANLEANQTLVTASLAPSPAGRINGWNDQPNSRGTLDILWMCLSTTFLCTYTILCLNCPARNEGFWRTQARKLLWMAIAIAGPEFVLTAAAGQLAAARDSVKSFHALGFTKWTYRHGFFANMGGFELVPADGGPFRINSKHIHWLVSRGYISVPEVSDEELWDKSKQDTIAKLITCVQVAYLILQCIGRAASGLAVTTIELSTVAIVGCTLMTSLCWLDKPLDVYYPVQIKMDITMGQILQEAGPIAARPYRQTPLDFVDDLRPSWALNIQTFMKMPVGPFQRPIPRIGDSRLPWLTWTESSVLCLATLTYASIHLVGWNFEFPTNTEQILWRVSSLILLGTTIAFWILESIAMWYRYGGGQEILIKLFTSRTAPVDSVASSEPKQACTADDNTYLHEAPFEPRELPLSWEFWSIFPIAFIYGTARTYILVETLVGLRSLPWTTYLTVEWAQFFPHI
ncbi:hypothetical protein PENFLA_c015G02143 [Penicillium flavigenum]|uniref:Uncharacterized protein n=1 Tax=Penicillium flavigenum TaxID=254877 RepID=A0A1V6T433_9EURO|nr:hypothetical protein PENFLA_c015G02143 [Penicillium flavigenum]